MLSQIVQMAIKILKERKETALNVFPFSLNHCYKITMLLLKDGRSIPDLPQLDVYVFCMPCSESFPFAEKII